MTSTAPEPESQKTLRDRLLETMTDLAVDKPYVAVERVCDDMVGWLREEATNWHQRAAEDIDVMGYGKAAAMMLQGFADGIEAGRPALSGTEFPPQDVGVQ